MGATILGNRGSEIEELEEFTDKCHRQVTRSETPVGDEAEVNALLRVAQDAVLLKLQANSHLVSSSSSSAAPLDPLDDDLARRFDALKSRPPKLPAGSAGGMEEMKGRFAALKGEAGPEKETRVRLEDLGGGESESEDEVEKVMRWAMDAARLNVATAGSAAAGAEEEAATAERTRARAERTRATAERTRGAGAGVASPNASTILRFGLRSQIEDLRIFESQSVTEQALNTSQRSDKDEWRWRFHTC